MMDRRKRRWLLMVVAIAILSGAVIGWFSWRVTHRTAFPVEWAQIERGMERTAMLGVVTNEIHDWRELKGFDKAYYHPEGNGVGYWTLTIVYDAHARVDQVWVRYIDSPGFLNREGIDLLRR